MMALYNNGFPVTYPQIYQPPYAPTYAQPVPAQQPAQQVRQPAQDGGINWVQGEAAAKAYLVAPNSTVQLWDSESQTIYLKSADASGMPSMKVLDYTIRNFGKNQQNNPAVQTDDVLSGFATKDEIKAVSEQITALKERVDAMTRRRRREDDEE